MEFGIEISEVGKVEDTEDVDIRKEEDIGKDIEDMEKDNVGDIEDMEKDKVEDNVGDIERGENHYHHNFQGNR